jgi:5-hydroxyisourate hydrolase
MSSPITTHILDTARGCPAGGVEVRLERRNSSGEWQEIGRGISNADGRVTDLLASDFALKKGEFRLTFFVAPYFQSLGVESFYPRVSVAFMIQEPAQHYHVPLLLSPFGYSTYRGS